MRTLISAVASLLVCLLWMPAFGAEPVKHDREIEYLQSNVSRLQTEVAKLKQTCADLQTQNKRESGELRRQNEQLRSRVDSLSRHLTSLGDSLGVRIGRTDSNVSNNQAAVERDLGRMVLLGGGALMLALLLAACIYFVLQRRIGRGAKAISGVKHQSQQLAEQTVALDNKLAELLEHQIKSDEALHQITQQNAEPDHSLVLSVASELVRIEQNLAFMDPKTRGVPQLKSRAAAISSSLKKKGYEIPNLVGTEFKDGMNYEAVMEEDEEMEPGVMRIKRVTQPCVMYQGKMIQPAKVVVAYKPED